MSEHEQKEGDLKIVRLVAENFKRLTAIDITPTRTVTKISGKNGAGKSSVLDSIAAVLGGPKLTDPVPIKSGETSAEVTVDLGELKVRRKWTAKGSYLEVFAADGSKLKSPQAVLDALFDAAGFDPFAFSRMTPAQQRDALIAMLGLGSSLDALDAKRQALYAERTDVGRQADRLTAQISAMPAPSALLPDSPVDVSALGEQLQAAKDRDREISNANQRIANTGSQLARIEQTIEDLKAERESLSARMAELAELISENTDEAKALKTAIDDAAKDVPRPIDSAAIVKEIRDAEFVNAEIRARDERRKAEAAAKAEHARYEKLSKEIAAIDADKAKLLSGAEWPVDGLGFGANGITYNGVPFEQASSAERLRISVAIGMRQNKRLRVMAIRDGSLLDSDSMKIIEDAAEAEGYQVFVEVTDSTNKIGIVIADGMIVANNDAA